MAFYLEYTIREGMLARSAVPGAAPFEAMAASLALLRESGCAEAVMRCSDSPDDVTGQGRIVAVYRVPDGWQAPPSCRARNPCGNGKSAAGTQEQAIFREYRRIKSLLGGLAPGLPSLAPCKRYRPGQAKVPVDRTTS
jgi:hypothetical protein